MGNLTNPPFGCSSLAGTATRGASESCESRDWLDGEVSMIGIRVFVACAFRAGGAFEERASSIKHLVTPLAAMALCNNRFVLAIMSCTNKSARMHSLDSHLPVLQPTS